MLQKYNEISTPLVVLTPLEVRVRAPQIVPKVYRCVCIVHAIGFQSLSEAILSMLLHIIFVMCFLKGKFCDFKIL